MAVIYETENFILESHEKPEVDRTEWWHLKISPKFPIEDRSHLSPKQAIELMRFTIISWLAMKEWMSQRWVKIGRINYQDNWNRKPELHIHLYARAIDAIIQKYGEPILPWHKEWFQALDEEDILAIKKECESLFTQEKFSDKERSLI